jgi:release factor glutamine methyltransferase
MSQTVTDLYKNIRAQLTPITASDAQADAEACLILDHVLHIPKDALYSNENMPIEEEKTKLIGYFLDQRIQKRIPIQYLMHQAYFYGLTFYVNPHVLIPRPETELLVGQVLQTIQDGMRILDVGTGPGTIAIALSHHLATKTQIKTHIVATDISDNALKVARINQKALGTTVEFKSAGDLYEPIGTERFDIIVSNPPYVDPGLAPTLTPEVLWHEPTQALFPPGEDIYYFYRRLIQEGKVHLTPGGHMILETGVGMTPAISQLFTAAGYTDIRIIRDYADLDRIVTAKLL